jgi:hypothetical protein
LLLNCSDDFNEIKKDQEMHRICIRSCIFWTSSDLLLWKKAHRYYLKERATISWFSTTSNLTTVGWIKNKNIGKFNEKVRSCKQ